jgi:hypothetical protein
MSVFKVQLNNVQQGLLDLDMSTNTSTTYGLLGSQFAISKQRQIWVAGPNRKYRLLKDGDQFTDCNYWKQFAYPQTTLEKAFISVVTDDGSVYSSNADENTFTKGATVALSTSFADTVIDFVTTYGGPARFLSVQNLAGSSINIVGELNGDTNVTFTIGQGETMMFNQGDMMITMLRLKSASSTPNASWIASIASTCNS